MFRSTMFAGILGLVLFSVNVARADDVLNSEICSFRSECEEIIRQADVKIQKLIQELKNINSPVEDFTRNNDENRSVKVGISPLQAAELCKAEKKQLPTARQLAIDATRYGAEILELSNISGNKVPKGFRLVSVKDMGLKIDRFYYNKDYYNPPENERQYLVWSSSIKFYLPDEVPDIYENADVFAIDGESGTFFYTPADMKNGAAAVRCAKSNNK